MIKYPPLQMAFSKTFILNYPNQPSQSVSTVLHVGSLPLSQDWSVAFHVCRLHSLTQASGGQNWESVKLVLPVSPVTIC